MTDNRRAANGKKQTDRIAAMERRMDAAAEALQALETALDGYEAALPGLAALAAYYDGGDWRKAAPRSETRGALRGRALRPADKTDRTGRAPAAAAGRRDQMRKKALGWNGC